jgi:hypothetical protein
MGDAAVGVQHAKGACGEERDESNVIQKNYVKGL